MKRLKSIIVVLSVLLLATSLHTNVQAIEQKTESVIERYIDIDGNQIEKFIWTDSQTGKKSLIESIIFVNGDSIYEVKELEGDNRYSLSKKGEQVELYKNNQLVQKYKSFPKTNAVYEGNEIGLNAWEYWGGWQYKYYTQSDLNFTESVLATIIGSLLGVLPGIVIGLAVAIKQRNLSQVWFTDKFRYKINYAEEKMLQEGIIYAYSNSARTNLVKSTSYSKRIPWD